MSSHFPVEKAKMDDGLGWKTDFAMAFHHQLKTNEHSWIVTNEEQPKNVIHKIKKQAVQKGKQDKMVCGVTVRI